MAHINNLHPQDLYRILCFVLGEPATNIDEWKRKLSLLHVCSKWYGLLKDQVFSQAFIGVYPLKSEWYHEPAITNSCIFYADDNIVCRSNLGIIIGRDEHNCGYVSNLEVSVYDGVEIDHYTHVLEQLLTLGIGYWINLTSLKLFIQSNFDYHIISKRLSLEEFADNVRKMVIELYDRMPNISFLHLNCYDSDLFPSTFLVLIDQYAHCLQFLHIGHPIKAPLPSFSTELTSVSMNLVHYTHWDPTICARSLQFLELWNIRSSTFSWCIFHDYTTPGFIEFTDLKTLNLTYGLQTDKDKRFSQEYFKQDSPYGSHMLRFPKLRNLSLKSPPPDCDVFITDAIPTNMDSFVLSGNPNTVVAASRLRFTRVNKLDILVDGDKLPSNDFYKAAVNYFGYTKIGSSCRFRPHLQIDITRTIAWVNITYLTLETVELDKLLKFVLNLFNLRRLDIGTICLTGECLLIIHFGLEEEKQRVVRLFYTKLEYLCLDRTKSNLPQHALAFLNHIILRTPNLKKVETSKELHLFVGEGFLPGKFKHIEFVGR